MASLQAKADAVKAAVASISTCTAATVVTVKELLLPDVEATCTTTAQNTAKRARSNTNPKTKTNTLASRSKTVDHLSVKDRAALATHIINTTIKTLAEAAKPAPATTTTSPKQHRQEDAKKGRTLRRSLSAPLSPVPARTLNRTTTSPTINLKTTSTHQSSTQTTGCLATVECTRTAFACLRSIRGPVQANQADFQLETGMSAFVGKLLALGLQDQAIKELRILKRRLDAALSRPAAKPTKSTTTETQTTSQVIAELLDYEGTISDESLTIVTTCQVQVLRLIALSKKPAFIEAAMPYMDQEHASSPLNLLQKLAQLSDKDGQKAARQIATVSQILLSWAPSVSSKEDHVATEARLSPCPYTAFQLQVLCFKAQLQWWKLAGHKGNADEEILSPFARCVRAFIRRQSLGEDALYDILADSFHDLMDLVLDQPSQPAESPEGPLASIYNMLGVAAQTERQYGEACEWFEKLKALFQPGRDSSVKIFSISARFLAAALKKHPFREHADELALQVVEGLDGSLSGSVSELNELLESLSLARRAAVGILAGLPADKDTPLPANGVPGHLKTLVSRFPRFARRWLGAAPGKDASPKHLVQFDQRRQLLMQTISQLLDGALMVVKCDMQSDSITWSQMDETLQDCAKLVETVADPLLSAPRDQLSSYCIKISGLYFSKFSMLRQLDDRPSELNKQMLQMLSRSIDAVKDRSPVLQERAQLSVKLELFADLCRRSGRGVEAVKTLRSICTNMIEEGALLKVTAALAVQSPTRAWSVDEKAETLSRTLRSIAKLDQSWNDWAFFLPEAERAAVLEHLMQISGQGRPLKLQDESVAALVRLYTPERFPVRRLRVMLCLFLQNLGEGSDQDDVAALAAEALERVDGSSASEDSGLTRHLPHLKALHTSITALAAAADAPFRADVMQGAVSAWKAMTDACRTREQLDDKIDNVDGLLNHLRACSEFASLRGENRLQLAVLELLTAVSKLSVEPTNDAVILNHTLLASQHLNIGHYAQAKKTLEAAEVLLEQAEGASRGIVAGFHLSQAEYYTGIGSFDEATSSLASARQIYNEPTSSWANTKSQATLTLAAASFLDSTLALKQGRVQEALVHIKSSVRALTHDWARLEQAGLSREDTPSILNTSTSSVASVKEKQQPPGQLMGTRFWALAYPLLRGLLHVSSVYAHLGMFQETVYYADSALRIAESTESRLYKAQVLAWTGSVYHRAARLEKALDYGNEARRHLPDDVCVSRVRLACQLGDLYRDMGDEEKATEMLKLAEETAERLGGQGKLESAPEEKEEKEKQKPAAKGRAAATTAASRTTRSTRTTRVKPVTATAPAPRTTRATRTTRAKTPAAKAQPAASVKEILDLPKDVYQGSLMASVILSRALGFINQRDWTSAMATLELGKKLPKLFGTLSQEQVATAVSLIGSSMEQMMHDPVFSVVQDSTISFPAVSSAVERMSLGQSPVKKSTRAAKDKASSSSSPAFADALRQAQELLLEAHAATLSTANSTTVHRISALLQNTVILLSATSTSQAKVLAGSGFATFSVDLARNVTWKREQSTLVKEVEAAHNGQAKAPPRETAPPSARRVSLGLTTEMSKFQRDYVELVPHNWSVVSVSLSDNRHDLCITKFQAGHSPFILRLPLERANSRDADSEVFNFEHGREEMMDIIAQANETSHSGTRDFSAKGARTAWWEERAALDERLRDLLATMETTWLGGFRGIFSQHERRPDLLARFQKTFEQILDSSLPSRNNRMRGKRGANKAAAAKVSLDARILDLFVGLGDPEAVPDDGDFDEALNDLLYFVVDILQFHGERNAYDEIDFDAMVVETGDALRGYHAATRDGAARMEGAHTVLVLDKALHAFPWESMPCMEGLAVSRVPSLACLRQLILEAKPSESPDAQDAEGHYVSATHGTYMLNPSTDLKNTQATFQSPLQTTLPSWTAIVNRAPTEAEFESALSGSDIVLYFGHGSGAQYLRARTVRRLGKCRAATFLMGCSSASLTQAGEFECYGPVWNYMMAGCPAVVGTLWDVTDRDIDRFAGRSFEEWGLFPRGTFKEEKKKKRGKAVAVTDEDTEEEDDQGDDDGEVTRDVSLAEAVARARQACRFKYLNAAAVVLYGIPVYINRGEKE